MKLRDETAETPCETGARSPGTDTLPRVHAWCLSPSELGQAPSRTTEPVPEQYVEAARDEPARQTALRATPHLKCVRG